MHGGSCDRPSGRVRIDQTYIDTHAPIVKEQLQKAGIRLADLLEGAGRLAQDSAVTGLGR